MTTRLIDALRHQDILELNGRKVVSYELSFVKNTMRIEVAGDNFYFDNVDQLTVEEGGIVNATSLSKEDCSLKVGARVMLDKNPKDFHLSNVMIIKKYWA